jgi:hypothetical protein
MLQGKNMLEKQLERPRARKAWLISPLQPRVDELAGTSFAEWWGSLQQCIKDRKMEKDMMELPCLLCWSWKAKNDLSFNDQVLSSSQILGIIVAGV